MRITRSGSLTYQFVRRCYYFWFFGYVAKLPYERDIIIPSSQLQAPAAVQIEFPDLPNDVIILDRDRRDVIRGWPPYERELPPSTF